jgi:hypothetical protein
MSCYTTKMISCAKALSSKMKHKKKGYKLDLQQREEYHGGATVWSLWKVRESQAQMSVN